MVFRRLFSTASAEPRGPEGWRAYVIGDVHGRLDLLDRLLYEIERDHEARGPAKGLLVLLGDLIDRGPQSAVVIERVRNAPLPGFRVVALAGNHEEVLLAILNGNGERLASWLTFGGAEALASYGLDPDEIGRLAPDQAVERIRAAVPETHRRFLESLADSFRFGDYLFVHAGIRPGVPIEAQTLQDLRWIREPFLSDSRDHGVTVVHGHTMTERVVAHGSRIGVDTGAYASGRLSALGIEGAERWVLDTIDGRAASIAHV